MHGTIPCGEQLNNEILSYLQELNDYFTNSGEILRNSIIEYIKNSWDVFKSYTKCPDLATLSKINAFLCSFVKAQNTLLTIEENFKLDPFNITANPFKNAKPITIENVKSNSIENAKFSKPKKSRKKKPIDEDQDFTEKSNKIAKEITSTSAVKSNQQTTPKTFYTVSVSNKFPPIASEHEMDLSQKLLLLQSKRNPNLNPLIIN